MVWLVTSFSSLAGWRTPHLQSCPPHHSLSRLHEHSPQSTRSWGRSFLSPWSELSTPPQWGTSPHSSLATQGCKYDGRNVQSRETHLAPPDLLQIWRMRHNVQLRNPRCLVKLQWKSRSSGLSAVNYLQLCFHGVSKFCNTLKPSWKLTAAKNLI